MVENEAEEGRFVEVRALIISRAPITMTELLRPRKARRQTRAWGMNLKATVERDS